MPSPLLSQAFELYHAQQFERAEVLLRQLLRRSPMDTDAMGLLAMTLTVLHRLDEAEHFYQRVLAMHPTDNMRRNLGHLYCMRNQTAKALEQFELSVKMNPGAVEGHKGVGVCALAEKRYGLAMDAAQRAHAMAPNDPETVSLLAGAQLNTFRTQECIATLRAGLALGSPGPAMIQQYLMTLHYAPDVPASAIAEAHRTLGPMAVAPASDDPAALALAADGWQPPKPGPADAQRCLRVGVLSSDLNRHVVAGFLAPLLEHIDRRRIEFVLFNAGRHDDTTDYLARLAAGGYDVSKADDATLVASLRRERLDVLIETNGWTNGHRLSAVARRAAPLQMNYLGYPDTTGVPAVDCRLVDGLTDPPGVADVLATERLVRIEGCFVCFTPLFSAAPVVEPPAGRPPTFGSFANGWKLNDALFSLWARVLRAVPGSRLALKNMGTGMPEVLERWLGVFEREGIDRSRILTLPWAVGAQDHLEAYGEVDIALDTFPYHGTTTTCDALFMGVPVVTLVGDTHHSRVGRSLLTHAGPGCAAWIADTPDEYVRIAAGLAADVANLRRSRAGLRERVRASRLMDGPAFATAFEAAVRGAWQGVCARAQEAR